MFTQIPSFNSDMSSWDVASVTDMHVSTVAVYLSHNLIYYELMNNIL